MTNYEISDGPLTPRGQGGHPLRPIDTVLIGLNILGGSHYQRMGGLAEGVSISTARCALYRFCSAVNEELADWTLFLPPLEKMESNAAFLEEKYSLPHFSYGVDGVFLFFEDKPQGIPHLRTQQSFFGRKCRYAINAQVVGGPDGLIYDLDLSSPGSFADSTTWRSSRVKPVLEQQHPLFRLAGDSGYPKSKLLVTPYSMAEARAPLAEA